jgi:hypothetical protein
VSERDVAEAAHEARLSLHPIDELVRGSGVHAG